MKPKKLRFVEQFIEDTPPLNYWRGITAYLGDEWVFHIGYEKKENKFDEPTHFNFDTCLGSPGSDFRRTIHGVTKRTKEEAKEFAQEKFDEYVKSLCDKD